MLPVKKNLKQIVYCQKQSNNSKWVSEQNFLKENKRRNWILDGQILGSCSESSMQYLLLTSFPSQTWESSGALSKATTIQNIRHCEKKSTRFSI